jgi:hypothetical protein
VAGPIFRRHSHGFKQQRKIKDAIYPLLKGQRYNYKNLSTSTISREHIFDQDNAKIVLVSVNIMPCTFLLFHSFQRTLKSSHDGGSTERNDPVENSGLKAGCSICMIYAGHPKWNGTCHNPTSRGKFHNLL